MASVLKISIAILHTWWYGIIVALVSWNYVGYGAGEKWVAEGSQGIRCPDGIAYVKRYKMIGWEDGAFTQRIFVKREIK